MDNIDKYKNYVLANDVTIRQLQDKLLEIFMYFKKICEDNGLNYWCGGGTMLGAVTKTFFEKWTETYESTYYFYSNQQGVCRYVSVRFLSSPLFFS